MKRPTAERLGAVVGCPRRLPRVLGAAGGLALLVPARRPCAGFAARSRCMETRMAVRFDVLSVSYFLSDHSCS